MEETDGKLVGNPPSERSRNLRRTDSYLTSGRVFVYVLLLRIVDAHEGFD